jgi:NAD(P)-dependent dehydrogenase (short-subunit alcohol dehydrogenase family)
MILPVPRAALITGAAQRLGLAVARSLAFAGFDIALHCRAGTARAEQAAADLPTRTTVVRADLSDEVQVAALIPRASKILGPIGVLINNASMFERDEWHNASRSTWNNHIEINLRAPFILMQQFALALPMDRGGVVINLLDQRVWSPTPHFVSYTVSKSGLWTLTQTMALALAPRIRVNGIGPGPALPSSRQSQEQFNNQVRSVPLRRGTSPEEVGRAALAIVSMPSMTGQMIALDGGQHLQWASGHGSPAPEE